MKHRLSLVEDFGPLLADGSEASKYRHTRIEPQLEKGDEIEVDFTGIRNANSSFVNALLAAPLERHGKTVLERLMFKGCNPLIRVLVEGAIDLGLAKNNRLHPTTYKTT